MAAGQPKPAPPESSPILRIETGNHASDILGIAVSDDGKWIATASYDKTLRIWSAATLEPVRTIRMPVGPGLEGAVYTVAFSPDGKTLATAGRTGAWENTDGPWCVYLIGFAEGDLRQKICDLPAGTNRVAYSRDGAYLAVASKCERPPLKSEKCPGRASVRVYRTADHSLAFEDKADDDVLWVEFSSTGMLVVTAMDGKLRLYGNQNDGGFRLIKSVPLPDGRNPITASFSPDGSQLAIAYAEPEGNDPRWPARVDVISSSDLASEFQPDVRSVDNGALTGIAWSSDGRSLYAGGTWRRGNRYPILRWTDGGKGRPQTVATASARIGEMRRIVAGNIAFVSGLDFGLIGTDRVIERRARVADFTDLGERLAASRDGTSVQFTFEPSGGKPAYFSFSQRILRMGEAPADLGMTSPVVDHLDLDLRDWEGSYRPTLNGEEINIRAGDRISTMAIAPKKKTFVLGSSWYVYHFDARGKQLWRTEILGHVRGLMVTSDERLVIAALSDGTLRWFALDTGKELVALFASPDDERWVAWTPSGYYMASAGGDGLIGWHVNRGRDKTADFFSIARFRDIYYRPDVVEKILGALDEGQAIKRGDVETGRTTKSTDLAALLPPVVTISSPANGVAINTSKVSFTYDIRRLSAEPIKALQVRADGRPVAVVEAGAGPIPERGTIKAYVPRRDATIEMIAETAGGIWSEPAAVKLHWTGPAEEIKPSLFILAIGISQYRAPELRLALADKDASDFKNVFDQQKKAYRKVEIVTLENEKATSAEIRRALDWFASAPTSHDVAMLFMAGHGVDDQGGQYFFVPQEVGPKEALSQGLSYQDIRRSLASVAGRVLFFIDTCHAGAAWGNPGKPATDVSRIVNDLNSPENRVMTFASSTGRQLSYERVHEWGNGAFTKAVVEGLTGKADFFQNGYVTASQLDTYVSDRVPKLTLGQQTPAIGRPFGVDYPLVQLR